jgi:hypothetical protein
MDTLGIVRLAALRPTLKQRFSVPLCLHHRLNSHTVGVSTIANCKCISGKADEPHIYSKTTGDAGKMVNQVKVTLRPTVSRPVSGAHLGPSLTRGRVCNLLLLLAPRQRSPVRVCPL